MLATLMKDLKFRSEAMINALRAVNKDARQMKEEIVARIESQRLQSEQILINQIEALEKMIGDGSEPPQPKMSEAEKKLRFE